jgi:lipopolysaccharide export system protein LptA
MSFLLPSSVLRAGTGLLALSLSAALFAAEKPAVGAAPTLPTVITSKTLDMRSTDTETHAIFDQNVVVTGNNMRITCDHLDVLASRLGDKDATVGTLDKFKTLVATGHVHIVQGDRDVTCGRAEVFPGENRVVLTESPVVIDTSGPYVAKGTRIILLRGERRLFGDNIEMTGPPIKDLGFDKEKPMQSPASSSSVPVGETPPALRRDSTK